MNFIKKHSHILISALLGAVIFIAVFGVGTLDVTNDGWILTGYDEWDIVQRYVGWMNYRNSDWTFPLANLTNVAYPDGANIAFMDSIPIISVLFKLISPILPETFQFCGILMLAIFVLQGISSSMLIYELCRDKLISVIGSVFFILSPILLERGFRHTSLAAHYIVLFALYYYFKYRNRLKLDGHFDKLPLLPMAALSALSVGITPYFLPMVMIFVLTLCLDYMRMRTVKKGFVKSAVFFVTCCASGIATGLVLGTLGQGVSSSRWGYGFFSLNLISVINPRSCGEYTWSSVLPVRGWVNGQYDGFNYLGLGILLFVVFIFAAALINLIIKKDWRLLKSALAENGFLIASCIFLTCFAITNTICFSNRIIVEIPLPQFILDLCGIFRASGRIFWPVYYIIFTFAIVCCSRIFSQKKAVAVATACLFLVIQVYDLNIVLAEKHNLMEQKLEHSFNGDPELLCLDGYTTMIDCHKDADRYWLYINAVNNLVTTGSDFNSGNYENAIAFSKAERNRIKTEPLNKDYIYVTDETDRLSEWKERFSDSAQFYSWQTEQPSGDFPGKIVYFMVPDK